MKANSEPIQKRGGDLPARIKRLDGRLARLDGRLQKNQAAFNRNNDKLNLMLAELCERLATGKLKR